MTAKLDLGSFGFSSIPTTFLPRISATPNRCASVTSLRRIFAPSLLLLEVLHGLADIVFNNVVAEDDADRLAGGEILRQTQGFGNAAFAFLIGIIQMLQPKIAAVSQQAEKISGIFSARDEKDFFDSRIHERLDGVIHHWLVINGQEMLVRDPREWIQPTARSTS